jgi:hypothetical protein
MGRALIAARYIGQPELPVVEKMTNRKNFPNGIRHKIRESSKQVLRSNAVLE